MAGELDTASAVDDFLKQPAPAQAARESVSLSITSDPDAEANFRRLSAQSGVPVDSVRAFPNDVKNQVKLNSMDFDQMARDFPATTKFLANPNNATIAHDETSSLTGIEQGLRSFLAGGSLKRSGAGSYLGASLKAGTLDLVGAGAKILETLNPFTTSDAELATLYKNDPEGLARARGSAPNALSTAARAMTSGSAEAMQDISPEAKKAYAGLEYATTDTSKAAYLSPVKVVGDVVRSLPTTVALAVSVYLTRGSATTAYNEAIAAGATPEVARQASIAAASQTMARVGAVSEGSVGFAQQSNQVVEELSNAANAALEKSPRYQELIAAGYAPEAAKQATIAAVAQEAGQYAGIVDAAVNKVGGAFLGKILTEGGAVVSRVLKGGANEAITETVQSAGEQFGENAARKRLYDPSQELSQGVLEAAIQGAVVGFVSGGSFSGLAGAGKTIDQAKVAEADAQRIQQLFDLAGGSKLKERDPDSLAAFIQSTADSDAGIPSALYIDASTLVETLQQAGVTPEQFAQSVPAVGTQLKDALASGDAIELPIGELTANLAGSGLEAVLLQHLRTSPEALSLAEAKAATQQAQKELARQADEAIALSAEVEALRASAEVVRDTISAQLTAANRFTKDVNDAYASLVRDFYTVTAQRLGITPEQLYARYPLKVTAATNAKRTDTLDAKLDQPANLTTTVSTEPVKRSKTDQELLDMVHPPGPNDRSIRAVINGKEVGHLDLAVRADGKLADVREVRVAPKYRRKGVATALYDAARAQGFEVQRSQYQTDEGSAFRDSYDKRSASQVSIGIEPPAPVNKYASKFLAGRDVSELSDEARAQYESLVKEMPAPDGTLEQPARGNFSPSRLNITLLQHADLSTFLHELGHFQLEMLADLASQPNAPLAVQQDMGEILKWFGIGAGVGDIAMWRSMTLEQQRPYHEQFARGFEAYLFEGKSPSVAMAGIFQRFRDWMKNVYRSLTALNVTLTDEVRGVFDRLLATDQQIAEAEQGRAYAPLFADPEAAGMTPEEFAAYQQQGAQATAKATDELQERSLKDMRWLTGARSRALKALQQEAKAKRKAVEEEVTAEVHQMPVYAVQRWIKGKGLPDGSPAAGAKLSMPMLKEFYGEGPAAPWRYLATNLVTVDPLLALPPDDIATMFGYTSGDALVRDIINSDTEAVMIEGMTDQRMLERYGDLATPEAQARAADEAVHNEARSKFVATELRALQKATNVREKTAAGGTVNVMLHAAREYAATVISRKVIKDVKPNLHAAAEARAARQAEQALAKGDLVAAATAKRNQLLSNATTKEAYTALTDVEKTREFFRKVMSGKDDVVGKTRDMDVVNAARAVIAQYGIGINRGKTALEYMELVQKNDPLLYDVLKAPVDAAIINAKPFDQMTVEEMRGLRDEMQAMWHLAKRTREMVVGGELIDRQVAADALLARMNEIGVPDSMPGDTSAVTPAEKRLAMLRTVKAAAVRVESWAGAKDGAAPIGPFRKYIWQVVKEAADAYRADKAVYLKKYRALLEGMKPAMKRELIEAPEIGYTFGKGKGGVGMSELLHALLHTGNDSNKRKLLVGRKWATLDADGNMDTSKWDRFVARMVAEGKITKQSYDFVQAVWNLLEETKPLAQKAHRDVFGKYFAEVTANSFDTPFGPYRGGYAPAIADPEIVQDASLRALAEAENENMAFAFPGTNKGFTKGRVEYNRPLKLDLRSIGQHLDKVLLFSHMEQPVRDVRKLLSAKGVSYALGRVDPAAIGAILTPWLNRSARQQVETPIVGDGGAARWFTTMRNNAGMAAMFANVANTVQQLAGFSLAAVKVKPKYLLWGMAEYTKSPSEAAKTVAEASVYMANRMDNEVSAMNSAINDILLDPGLYDKGKAWMQRHAYFMQSAVDNVMGPIIWMGARNQALEQGMSEADAIRLADSAVRETQGTTQPEDVSRIETGNAFVRLFTQFAGYFNMQANLLGGEFAKIQHAGGLRKGAGRALYVVTFGFLVNAWAAEAIMQAFKGGPDDEDKDGEYLDDWLWQVFGMAPIRNLTAMIPGAGQVINAGINAGNSKPYDDRIATSPAVSMIEATVRAPYSLYKAMTDQGKKQKAVRDVATAISMLTGIPVTGIARPLGYLAGVEANEIQPTSTADAVRGAVTGTASPESKH